MSLFEGEGLRDPSGIGGREWLLPDGRGGYAMGTLSGLATRRYHGLLVAALDPPARRTLLLGAVDASAHAGAGGDEREIALGANAYPGAIFPDGLTPLRSVEVLPDSVAWRYEGEGMAVEKTVRVAPSAARLEYRNAGDAPVLLVLRPLVAYRDHNGEFSRSDGYPDRLELYPARTEVTYGGTTLMLHHAGAERTPVEGWYYRFVHARETARGLPGQDDLYCPCELRFELAPGGSAFFEASLDTVPATPSEPRAPGETLRERLEDAARVFVVAGREGPAILAGYPWFSDWGRDAMIALPGLLLATGRVAEARELLARYGGAMNRGLVPNRFGETGGADYNTADATLWFFDAVWRTLAAEWEDSFAERMRVLLEASVDWHVRGTLYGIKVDPGDMLLTQGERGVQLTWMDAKIDDWVVTPRHGKPVEINALWANALEILGRLRERLGLDPQPYRDMAAQARASFERSFWHEVRGHYLDTFEPDDASLRPNQVVAMALSFSPCEPEHARRALAIVRDELLTPVGLRTLGPKEPGYQGRFRGGLRELDAAYHQGTVWPWLLGAYLTALVRYEGDVAGARAIWEGTAGMLGEMGIGGLAECYDGDEPREANGCPWQAWSVAESLRVAHENGF